ncbi:MAG: pyridoxamine 5'-phosphate oxidase family protein [Acidobacteria bacterium]|nr:pyridoxamine 5'-phosphate oxidase family protein [Acidobacteriota bacterium]
MALLNERMKEIFLKQNIFVLGTADLKGVPNVVPIGAIKILDDETILISDQFFLKTLNNLKENPKVAISFWELEKGEGYQIKGDASIRTEGKIYEDTVQWIREFSEKMGHPLQSKGAIVVKITEIYSVTPGSSAGQRIA